MESRLGETAPPPTSAPLLSKLVAYNFGGKWEPEKGGKGGAVPRQQCHIDE